MAVKQVDKNLESLLKDDGYFVVSKKSIKWGIGILSFVLVSLWGILQTGISEANKKSDKTNETLTTLVNELKEKKVEPLEEKVSDMKGDVKVLLDRTNSRVNSTHTNSNNTMPNLPTESTPPPM